MKKLYSINLCVASFLFVLFFTNAYSGISQPDNAEILESYRLKIVGEACNIYVENSKIVIDSELTKDKLEMHISQTFKSGQKTQRLLSAILNSGSYAEKEVPVVTDFRDLQHFYIYISDAISQRTKSERAANYENFMGNCEMLMINCKSEIGEPPTHDPMDDEPVAEDIVIDDPIDDNKLAADPVTADPVKVDPVAVDPVVHKKKEDQIIQQDSFSQFWKTLIFLNLFFFIILLGLFFFRRKNQKTDLDELNQKILISDKKLSRKISENTDHRFNTDNAVHINLSYKR